MRRLIEGPMYSIIPIEIRLIRLVAIVNNASGVAETTPVKINIPN